MSFGVKPGPVTGVDLDPLGQVRYASLGRHCDLHPPPRCCRRPRTAVRTRCEGAITPDITRHYELVRRGSASPPQARRSVRSATPCPSATHKVPPRLPLRRIGRAGAYADEYAKAVNDHPAPESPRCGQNPERGRAGRRLGVGFAADYFALITRPDIDGVVSVAHRSAPRVDRQCSKAGKHVLPKGVARLDDTYAIAAAVRIRRSVSISFPRRTMPARPRQSHARFRLGGITLVRIRIPTARCATGYLNISSIRRVRQRRDDRSRRARRICRAGCSAHRRCIDLQR